MLVALFLVAVLSQEGAQGYFPEHLQLAFTVNASYYSWEFEGRQMTNGERFRCKKLTLAHRTLPLGTEVELSDETGKTIKATVKDRGPHVKGKDIDVSLAIAEYFNFTIEGSKELKLKIIKLGVQ